MEVLVIPTDQILVAERIRKEFDESELKALADSIAEHGQLQPIGVVELEAPQDGKRYKLVYGHRRLLACQRLGQPVKAIVLQGIKDELSEKIAEFVENAVRKDFTPVEKAQAVKQLHEELRSKHLDWTVEKTARLLGLSRQYVHDLLRAANWAEAQKNVLDEETLKRLTMRQLRQVTSLQGQVQRIVEEVRKAHKDESPKCRLSLHHGNAFEWRKLGIEPGFQLIITDPPYGIDFARQTWLSSDLKKAAFQDNQGADWFTRMWKLFDELADKENAAVVVFCSVENFLLFRELAKAHGFRPYPRPLVWIKCSAGQPANAEHFPTSCHEFMLYAHRPKFRVVRRGRPDWFSVPRVTGNDRFHPTQKPVALFREILQWLALPSYRMIDPFAGSASSLIAAWQVGLKEAVGIELNDRIYKLALEWIRRNTVGEGEK